MHLEPCSRVSDQETGRKAGGDKTFCVEKGGRDETKGQRTVNPQHLNFLIER